MRPEPGNKKRCRDHYTSTETSMKTLIAEEVEEDRSPIRSLETISKKTGVCPSLFKPFGGVLRWFSPDSVSRILLGDLTNTKGLTSPGAVMSGKATDLETGGNGHEFVDRALNSPCRWQEPGRAARLDGGRRMVKSILKSILVGLDRSSDNTPAMVLGLHWVSKFRSTVGGHRTPRTSPASRPRSRYREGDIDSDQPSPTGKQSKRNTSRSLSL